MLLILFRWRQQFKLLLVSFPSSSVYSHPFLNPDGGLIISNSAICTNHTSHHHPRHLNIPGKINTQLLSFQLEPNVHFELNGQATVYRRHGISSYTQNSCCKTPLEGCQSHDQLKEGPGLSYLCGSCNSASGSLPGSQISLFILQTALTARHSCYWTIGRIQMKLEARYNSRLARTS